MLTDTILSGAGSLWYSSVRSAGSSPRVGSTLATPDRNAVVHRRIPRDGTAGKTNFSAEWRAWGDGCFDFDLVAG
ncbi:hypothetical protein [Thauera sp. Sel9]|uniref:hypothetical protein n=1 Tax=Thauera sp. Sel9 TaxID=2974299 RepID=UPI0021E15384|nr:hypothetical protein [Thauera sp. Sel9]MCV2218440.1 hypothetical protein [Thauera sp. Sel9]